MSEEQTQAAVWQWKASLRTLNQELDEVEGIITINEPAYAHITSCGKVYNQLNQLMHTLTTRRLELIRQVGEAEKRIAQLQSTLQPAPKARKK